MNVKYLILDAGGVLVYPLLGEWHIPYRAAEILGPRRAESLGTPRFRHAREGCMRWLDESRLVMDVKTERLLRAGFVMELDRAMDWRMTDAEIRAMADDFTDNADRYGFFDDVKPWLERWSKSYTLALLSDAMPSILDMLRAYGIADYFAASVISTHVGATKPDSLMYETALHKLGARPEECLFADDRMDNVLGAVRAGMRAVQMSRPEFPAAALWDGPVVHGFEELNALLTEG